MHDGRRKNRNTLSGVLAAIITPVDGRGEPDMDRFERHAGWLMANGSDGLNVLGTTGEANSLSKIQRLAVMSVAANGIDAGKLMVGTGTPDIQTTIELTRAAQELGFAGALVLPPYYYKGVSDEGLFAWYAAIVEATEAIPIYLYNFPQMTGLPLSTALVRRLAKAFPERICGAKDSSGDLAYAAELAAIGDLAIFPSDEGALARAGRDGFAGCISATVNITAPLAARLWAEQENVAFAEAARLARTAITAQPLIPAVKHLVATLHGDPEFARVLTPHLELDAKQREALAKIGLSAIRL